MAHRAAASAARWCAFVVACAIPLWPTLAVVVYADDLQNPFQQFASTGPSLSETVRYAWDQSVASGHLSFLGNQVLAAYNVAWLLIADSLPGGMQDVYVLTRFVVVIGAIVAGGWLLGELLGLPDRWPARVQVAVPLLASLQLHSLWSNDPVASFPLSGFASAIVGLVTLAVGVRALRSPHRVGLLLGVGALVAVSIAYYEMNAAVVPALASHVLISSSAPRRRAVRAVLGRLLPIVGIPLIATAALWAVLRGGHDAYAGTTVAFGGRAVTTFLRSMAGTLPGSAWGLVAEETPATLDPAIIVGCLAVGLLGSVLVLAHRRSGPLAAPDPEDLPGAGVVAGVGQTLLRTAPVAVYWVGAVGIQAVTVRMQTDIRQVGYVYNFYAVGALCAAIIAAAVWRVCGSRLSTVAARSILAATVLLGVVQHGLNWQVQRDFNAVYAPNRELLAAFDGGTTQDERCRRLTVWREYLAWPSYYEDGMVLGLDRVHRHLRGHPFCLDQSPELVGG